MNLLWRGAVTLGALGTLLLAFVFVSVAFLTLVLVDALIYVLRRCGLQWAWALRQHDAFAFGIQVVLAFTRDALQAAVDGLDDQSEAALAEARKSVTTDDCKGD